jgi:DNA repair protein RadD
VVLLAHRKELLEQSAAKITQALGGFGVGIYSAGMRSRDLEGDVIVAGIQSVYRRACELGRFDLVLVDEAHRIPPDGEGMYRQFLEEAKVVNPRMRVIGLTATPYRMGTGLICGPENILHEVCYECGVRELIVDGYLSKLVSKTGSEGGIADTSAVHVRGGEFVESELEVAFSKEAIVSAAVAEVLGYAKDRRKVLIFSCGVTHAGLIVEALRAQGAGDGDSGGGVELVTGDTPMDERERILGAFRSGALKYLVNVLVLTEGFDAPDIDLIALLRATKSPGLYYQMVGRGLRLAPGKSDCTILDFGENILRHGPIDRIRPRKTTGGEGGGEAPVKVCPQCRAMVLVSLAACDQCGYEFPRREAAHERQASTEPILSLPWKIDWYEVESVAYFTHEKRDAPPGAPRTLRVEYKINLWLHFSEWVCVEHPPGSFPAAKAAAWWEERRRTDLPMPADAGEAARLGQSGALRCPRRIQVRQDPGGKELPRILRYEFEIDEEPSPEESVVQVGNRWSAAKSFEELISTEEIPF